MRSYIVLLSATVAALASFPSASAFSVGGGFSPSAMGVRSSARTAASAFRCLPLRLSSVSVVPAAGTASRSDNIIFTLKAQADDFSACKVTGNSEAADGLRLISLDVGSTISSNFKVPGQYVKAKLPAMEKPGFFAIASPPRSESTFDFLIKRTDGSSWFCDAAVGDSVEVSMPQGPGYKYAEKFGSSITDVVLLATGSGIAPLKAVVESEELKGKNVKLYYGCRTPASMGFKDDITKWEKECGVTVVPCISQGDVPDGMRSGYVQKVMMEDGIASPKSTGVLFCGVNDMVKEAKELLEAAGVDKDMMLGNF